MSYQPWSQGNFGPGMPGQPVQQPWNPGQAGYSGQAGYQGQQMPTMRASHMDRERAIDVLKAGFSEGRLSQVEYEQRLARAQNAQTYSELHLLLSDLPQGPVPLPSPTPQQYAHPPAPVPHTFLPAPPRTNGKAVGALVCGVLSPMTYGLTAIPAVILGHTAKAEIRRTRDRGDQLATGGLILGWIAIGLIGAVLLAVGVAAVLGG